MTNVLQNEFKTPIDPVISSILTGESVVTPSTQRIGLEKKSGVENANDLIVLSHYALPIGTLLQVVKETSPLWPFGENASKLTAEQLRCVRAEISTLNYENLLAKNISLFVKNSPEEAGSTLTALQDGGAEIIRQTFLAATDVLQQKPNKLQTYFLEQVKNDKEDRFLDKMANFVELMYAPLYQNFRDLTLISDFTGTNGFSQDGSSLTSFTGKQFKNMILTPALAKCGNEFVSK